MSEWYAVAHRPLPWREPSCTPWGVLVSEVMLQQTPVARVTPVWLEWLSRWPTPGDLARDASGQAVAAWGRLGYPRRALRLHATAVQCVEVHGGAVPETYAELLALPGVGDYTAAAVAAFAFGQRQVVLDTNVRRVLARIFDGLAFEPSGSPGVAERRRAASVLPSEAAASVAWNVALMELGATTCTARAPACSGCPVRERCAWRANDYPPWTGPPRRGQSYEGTDRQARGRLLAAVRDSTESVSVSDLDVAWPDSTQRQRALVGLVADGLLEHHADPSGHQTYALPGLLRRVSNLDERDVRNS